MESENKISLVNNEKEFIKNETQKIDLRKYECPVCGMDEWCGTDGCPMDPQ